jgi:hypothetical protein
VSTAWIVLVQCSIMRSYTDWRNEESGFDFLGRQDTILFIGVSKPVPGSTQPPVQLVTVGPSVGSKRPVREADFSAPANDKDNN